VKRNDHRAADGRLQRSSACSRICGSSSKPLDFFIFAASRRHAETEVMLTERPEKTKKKKQKEGGEGGRQQNHPPPPPTPTMPSSRAIGFLTRSPGTRVLGNSTATRRRTRAPKRLLLRPNYVRVLSFMHANRRISPAGNEDRRQRHGVRPRLIRTRNPVWAEPGRVFPATSSREFRKRT